MNTAGRPTVVQNTTEELLIRTLSSDISSLQHGNPSPVAEHITTHFAEQAAEETLPAPHHGSALGIIIAVLVLGGLGTALYYFLLPYIVGGVI
jgi:hypothetical protein